MKKAIITAACALGFFLNTTSAQALSLGVGDAYYLGFVDGVPASPEDAMAYVNYLAALQSGVAALGVALPGVSQEHMFSRVNSVVQGDFATAGLPGYIRTGGTQSDDVSGYSFLAAKYGTVVHVWVLNGLSGIVQFPEINGTMPSHWTVFQAQEDHPGPNPDPNHVPDGGATIGLLGLAMLGLGFLRHRLT